MWCGDSDSSFSGMARKACMTKPPSDAADHMRFGKRLCRLCYVLIFVNMNKDHGRVRNKGDSALVVVRPLMNLSHLFMISLSVLKVNFEIIGQVAINCLAVMSCGMTMAYPAVALPALATAGFDIQPSQVSLVGCAYYVMILFGSYWIGPVMDKWGRRSSLLFSVTPSIAGWVLAGSNDSIAALIAGMLFLGAGMGLINSCASVYISEVVSKEWKDLVHAIRGVAFSAGVTMMYFLGCLIRNDWRKISLISTSVPAMAFLLGIFYLKESNIWLLRPTKEGMNKYLFGLHKMTFWRALCSRPDVYKPYYTANAILILFHLSGSTVLITYAISLLNSAGVETDPYAIAVTLGLSQMAGVLLVAVFAESWGRRGTLVYSGTVMSFSLLYLARLHKLSGVHIVDWPIYTAEAFLACFICSSSMFITAAESLKGKIYPSDVRLGCRALSSFNSWIASCVVVVAYPVGNAWGLSNLFMVYASASVACAVLAILTMTEIEHSLDSGDGAQPLRASPEQQLHSSQDAGVSDEPANKVQK